MDLSGKQWTTSRSVERSMACSILSRYIMALRERGVTVLYLVLFFTLLPIDISSANGAIFGASGLEDITCWGGQGTR